MDDLDEREQEIVERALQLQQDLAKLQTAKNEALTRQLRTQLQHEASARLAAYETQLESETTAAIQRIAADKEERAKLLSDTQTEVSRQIEELQSRVEALRRTAEELDVAASAAAEYVRAEAAEKLNRLRTSLEAQVESRVQQFADYMSS